MTDRNSNATFTGMNIRRSEDSSELLGLGYTHALTILYPRNDTEDRGDVINAFHSYEEAAKVRDAARDFAGCYSIVNLDL